MVEVSQGDRDALCQARVYMDQVLPGGSSGRAMLVAIGGTSSHQQPAAGVTSCASESMPVANKRRQS